MEFKQALVNARHHIVFLFGLLTALVIAFSIETREQGTYSVTLLLRLKKLSRYVKVGY